MQNTMISTGSLLLDIHLGYGGYLPGIIAEISGPQESGKTTLCLHAIASAQTSGGLCAWIDADRSLSVNHARQCGVQIKNIYYCDPKSTEQALDTVLILSKSGAFSLIIIDSLPSLMPQQESRGEVSDTPDELNLALLSEKLAPLSRAIKKAGTIILITNQYDHSLSSNYHHLAKSPERLSLKMYASIRIRLKQICLVQKDHIIHGQKVQAQIIKNKYYSIKNPTEFDIILDRGINRSLEIFDLGLSVDLIRMQDQGIFYQSVELGRTPNEAIRFLDKYSQIRKEIEADIRRILVPQKYPAATVY